MTPTAATPTAPRRRLACVVEPTVKPFYRFPATSTWPTGIEPGVTVTEMPGFSKPTGRNSVSSHPAPRFGPPPPRFGPPAPKFEPPHAHVPALGFQPPLPRLGPPRSWVQTAPHPVSGRPAPSFRLPRTRTRAVPHSDLGCPPPDSGRPSGCPHPDSGSPTFRLGLPAPRLRPSFRLPAPGLGQSHIQTWAARSQIRGVPRPDSGLAHPSSATPLSGSGPPLPNSHHPAPAFGPPRSPQVGSG